MTPAYLVLVLLIALLGAYTDVTFGCVRNKYLVIALIVWLVLIVSENFFLNSSSIPVFNLALNFILSLITSIIFYLADIWAPGDCKFYIVISLIFPMNAYVTRNGNIFPALDFVIYSFALGYIFLFMMTFTHKSSEKPKINLGLEHALSILSNAGTISFVNILMNTFASEFFYANQMLCILSSVVFIFLIQKKADTLRKTAGLLFMTCFMIQSILSGTWFNMCMNLAISLITASAIEFLSSRIRSNTYREISGDEIRAGMILSFTTLWAMRKCIDHELPKTTTENRRSRITERQAEAIRRWCRKAGKNVVIVEMMPFAPFIAGSVVIQILRFIFLGR